MVCYLLLKGQNKTVGRRRSESKKKEKGMSFKYRLNGKRNNKVSLTG